MKINTITFGSKAVKMLTTTAILIGVSFTACKKDASPTTTATVTEQNAADLTTDAIVPENAGLVTQVNSSVTIYKTSTLSCGVQKDSTLAKSSASGATPSYDYSLNWNYLLDCSAETLTFNFTGNSTYNGVDMSSNDTSTGGFVLGSLQPSATQYDLNASYSRSGSQTSKVARQYTFTSNLKIVAADLKIDKTTQAIVSGTATVSITGASSSGKSFTFSGTVTFLGGGKATLVLNSGASYPIQW
jgi:hypothetical protein